MRLLALLCAHRGGCRRGKGATPCQLQVSGGAAGDGRRVAGRDRRRGGRQPRGRPEEAALERAQHSCAWCGGVWWMRLGFGWDRSVGLSEHLHVQGIAETSLKRGAAPRSKEWEYAHGRFAASLYPPRLPRAVRRKANCKKERSHSALSCALSFVTRSPRRAARPDPFHQKELS